MLLRRAISAINMQQDVSEAWGQGSFGTWLCRCFGRWNAQVAGRPMVVVLLLTIRYKHCWRICGVLR